MECTRSFNKSPSDLEEDMAKRKFQTGDRVKGRAEGRGGAAFRDRTGTVLGLESDGQYRVVFDGDAPGIEQCVPSNWIERLQR